MTHPGEQPPTVPGQPNQWPQPQTYGPPVTPPNPKLVWWTSGPGIVTVFAIAGAIALALLFIVRTVQGPVSDRFDLTVTSCSATTGALPTATVGFTITNTSSQARGATVQIVYRDGSGARLDTDTAHVSSIRPGETVRHDESTILDAEATGELDCQLKVTG